MFMYSHVQLCIAMHGGGRLGCMIMYAQVCACIIMYRCCMVMYAQVCSCIVGSTYPGA